MSEKSANDNPDKDVVEPQPSDITIGKVASSFYAINPIQSTTSAYGQATAEETSSEYIRTIADYDEEFAAQETNEPNVISHDDYFELDDKEKPVKQRLFGDFTKSRDKFSPRFSKGSYQGSSQLLEATELEKWWFQSPTWRRFIPFMCITMFIIGCLHLFVGIYLLCTGESHIPDPYVCTDPSCEEISTWVSSSMNTSVEPCDNFYELELNEDDTIASLLRRHHSNEEQTEEGHLVKIREDKIIRYYKACINERARKRDAHETLYKIISEVLHDVFHNFSAFDLSKVPAKVALITGPDFGTFGIHFLNSPNIALGPPNLPSILFQTNISDPDAKGTKRFRDALMICYSKLWKNLNMSQHFRDEYTYEEAVNATMKILQVIERPVGRTKEELRRNTTEKELEGIPEEQRKRGKIRTRRLLATYLYNNPSKGSEIKFVNSVVDFIILTEDDLFFIIHNLNKEFGNLEDQNPTGLRKGLTALWIFSLLSLFSEDSAPNVYEEFRFAELFPGTNRKLFLPIGRYCFESLVERLNALTMIHLKDDDPTKEAKAFRRTVENFKQLTRVIRRYIPALKDKYLYPNQMEIVNRMFNSSKSIRLNSPLHTEETAEHHSYLILLAKYYDKFSPCDNHLENVWKAREAFHLGMLNSWRNKTFQPDQEATYAFERLIIDNHDPLVYKNSITIPLSLTGQPFLRNRLPVLDHAGTGVFLARSLLELWRINRREPDALFHDMENEFNKIPQYSKRSRTATACLPPGTINRFKGHYADIEHSYLVTSLAFHIALELEHHPELYSSVRQRGTGQIAENIEFTYDDTGQKQFVEIDSNGKVLRILDEEDTLKYVPLKKGYKLVYTKLPGSLSGFSKERLFFIVAVRHLCQVINSTDPNSNSYMEDIHNSLSHVKEFAEAFDCPLGARMNFPAKCFMQDFHFS